MEATIKTLEPMRIVALRHIGPYHLIGPVFDKLMAWAGPAGVPIQGVLGSYYDDPHTVPAQELRSDAAIVVPADYELPADNPLGATIAEIPGGEYATATHLGSYEGLGDAWSRFTGEAIPATGRQTAEGVCFEMYMNDCREVPLEEVRTDMYVPVSPVTANV